MADSRSRRRLAPLSIIPALMAAAAFALALICILAGRRPGYLEDYSMITLNTSQIGRFNLSSSSPRANTFLNLLPKNISNNIQNLVGTATNDVAKALGVHDFYSAHMLTYCEGQYEPNSTVPATASKNVTKCSNETTPNTFNITNILQNELIPGVTLKDINWPDDIDNGIKAVRTAWKATFVLYVIGIAAAGLAMLGGLLTVFTANRISLLIDAVIALIAFLGIGLASAVATAGIVKASNFLNKYGSKIGLAAYRGHKFLAISWASTALMFIAACFWFGQCCLHRKRTRSNVKYG